MTSLAPIPPPIPLPSFLSDISSLSTVIDDPNLVDFPERMLETEKLLGNYAPASRKDDIANVLRCFLRFLPKRGRLQLMLDIELSALKSCLRDLRDYLTMISNKQLYLIMISF